MRPSDDPTCAPADAGAERPADRGVRDFFRYHGPWAPGVRLFRQLGFTAKSAMISAAFAIPLAVLCWGFFTANQRSVAFSAAERVGVAYLEALLPELEGAQDARNAAIRGTRAAAAATPALSDAQREHGGRLGTSAAWKSVEAARAAVAALPEGADAARRASAHDAHVQALLELASQAADGSNLTLDPDVDSFYMMDAATTKSPALLDTLARLIDAGHAIAASGRADAALAARADRLAYVAESQLDGLQRAIAKVLAQRADLAGTLAVDGAAAQVKRFLAASEAFHAGGDAREAGRAADAGRDAVAQLRAAQRAQLRALDAALAVRIAGLELERDWTAALVVVTLLIAAYFFRVFYLVTRGGLEEVGWHIEKMAEGDLTRSPSPWGRDEAASLMTTLASMQASLRRIVAHVRGSADAIVGASGEIAAGSMDLSGRTEQTAASLEESAASMEQISSTVRSSADNARRGASIAADNAAVARRGGEVIDEVVDTMQQIQEASSRIANIISVIDGIAFQTNILALNAAVEAARAGEQGRGFAVVAGEVRALSRRSAEAAREIKTLIEATVTKVEAGVGVVRSAGETMTRIVDNARQLESLSTAIADAAAQQDTGVSQVGLAIQDLDRGAQQNAALVEQTAAAAGQLRDQATALSAAVSVFRLPSAESA
jgi:methyl-accepting chemotaxis protein